MATIFNDSNFEKEVVEASKKKPVLVDFFAEWCGPCQMQGPIIDEIEKSYKGKVIVGKVDIDDSQKIAENYNVMSIPTLVLFKDGAVKESLTGMQAQEVLAKILEDNLK